MSDPDTEFNPRDQDEFGGFGLIKDVIQLRLAQDTEGPCFAAAPKDREVRGGDSGGAAFGKRREGDKGVYIHGVLSGGGCEFVKGKGPLGENTIREAFYIAQALLPASVCWRRVDLSPSARRGLVRMRPWLTRKRTALATAGVFGALAVAVAVVTSSDGIAGTSALRAEIFRIVPPARGSIRHQTRVDIEIDGGSGITARAKADALNAPYFVSVRYKREAVLLEVLSLPEPTDQTKVNRLDSGIGAGIRIPRTVFLSSPIGRRALINAGTIKQGLLPAIILPSLNSKWNRLFKTPSQRRAYVKHGDLSG